MYNGSIRIDTIIMIYSKYLRGEIAERIVMEIKNKDEYDL